MFNGEPGAVPKVIGHWMLRSALIMPGLAIAGVRDRRLVTASLLSSTFVSLFLIAYTAFERKRKSRHKRSLGSQRRPRQLTGHGQRALGTTYRATIRHRKLRASTSLCIEAKNKAEARALVEGPGRKILRISRGC